MSAANDLRVLAISLDAMDPQLARDMVDAGEMPTLSRLLETGGHWAKMDSRADVGSGAVWPTFLTRSDPIDHDLYFGWRWDPEAMTCEPGPHSLGFWRTMRDMGEAVGDFDVPFIETEPVSDGFSVVGWGVHQEILGSSTRAYPAWAQELVDDFGRAPFWGLADTPTRFTDRATRERLGEACLLSARMRADVVLRIMDRADAPTTFINFSEIHRCSHILWRTVDPDDPMYADLGSSERGLANTGIRDVYREVDRQAGRLIEAADPETAVAVYSLHGMKPARGIPDFLEALLVELGFAARPRPGSLSLGNRARALYGAAKRAAPTPLRRLYNRTTTTELRHRLARSTMVREYDWSRTRAFALPTDQHGYIKVNLVGREAEGIVPESEYTGVCDELEAMLLELRNPGGEPLVDGVLRTDREWGQLPRRMPDLIVHWSDAAHADRVRAVSGSASVEAEAVRPDRIGQHQPHGVCILDRRLAGDSAGEVIAGKDLHRHLVGERASAAAATG